MELMKHILAAHNNNEDLIQCPHCDYTTIDMSNIKDHMETDHQEYALLGHLAANQNALNKNFDKFKSELTNILNVIINDHNITKEELLTLRKAKKESDEKIDKVNEGVVKLTHIVSSTSLPSTSSTTSSDTSPQKPSYAHTNRSKASKTPQSATTTVPPKPPTIKKVLWVGDSHSKILDKDIFEQYTESKIDMVTAYTVDADTNAK